MEGESKDFATSDVNLTPTPTAAGARTSEEGDRGAPPASPGMLSEDKADGAKFLSTMNAVGAELSTITPMDVAGGMRDISRGFSTEMGKSFADGKMAVTSLDVKNGLSGFQASADAAQLAKLPAAGLQALLSMFFFVFYVGVFYPARYAPPAWKKTVEVVGPLVSKAGAAAAPAVAAMKTGFAGLVDKIRNARSPAAGGEAPLA